MASQVKNQMIIEAYGDFVRVKHDVSMCQVNPNKASRRKLNKCFHIIKITHDFFQRLIKQSQSFETSHATAKTCTYCPGKISLPALRQPFFLIDPADDISCLVFLRASPADGRKVSVRVLVSPNGLVDRCTTLQWYGATGQRRPA
jgi:hypothetical protein